jgi:hypothetical protein
MRRSISVHVRLVLLLLILLVAVSVNTAKGDNEDDDDYDDDDDDDYEDEDDSIVIISSFATDESLYDENGKLASFQLVYPYINIMGDTDTTTDYCLAKEQLDFPNLWYGFEHRAVAGDALKTVFPSYKPGDGCVAACLEKGTDRSVAGHTMPYQQYDPQTSTGTLTQWYELNCHRVEVCLVNYYNTERALTVHWIHQETKQAQVHNTVGPGDKNTRCFYSYLGHSFRVTDEVDGVIDEFTVEHSLVKAFGDSPPSGYRAKGHTFDKEIEGTLKMEWTRHNKVKRTFSPLGFDKGRLPPDVFASMGSFFHNNRNNKVREEWTGKGVYVNWWESNVCFIQIPWHLKELWQIRLADMVSAWAGVPVEQTVMYGLRQYEDGARLLTHVDRTATHAVSLIVNIAQGNLTEPWPVEVFDHADRLHEVLMEPGEVVYYESAKNLHSRNRPLTGKKGDDVYYVNLFTHYRPIGDGDSWYKLVDKPGVAPPLLLEDTVGDCTLKNVATTGTASGQLGIVQQVHCDDPRLGNYISPTLFRAEGPEDLVEWWRRTAPDYVEVEEQQQQEASTTTSESETAAAADGGTVEL